MKHAENQTTILRPTRTAQKMVPLQARNYAALEGDNLKEIGQAECSLGQLRVTICDLGKHADCMSAPKNTVQAKQKAGDSSKVGVQHGEARRKYNNNNNTSKAKRNKTAV